MGAPKPLSLEELRSALRWEDIRILYFERLLMWKERKEALRNRERYFYEFQAKINA